MGHGWVVVAGKNGRRLRSANGVDWQDEAVGGRKIGSLVFAEGKFLAWDDSGTVFVSSDDGRTWQTRKVRNATDPVVASGVVEGRRLFLGIGVPAQIKSSADGVTWETTWPGRPDENQLISLTFTSP